MMRSVGKDPNESRAEVEGVVPPHVSAPSDFVPHVRLIVHRDADVGIYGVRFFKASRVYFKLTKM